MYEWINAYIQVAAVKKVLVVRSDMMVDLPLGVHWSSHLFCRWLLPWLNWSSYTFNNVTLEKLECLEQTSDLFQMDDDCPSLKASFWWSFTNANGPFLAALSSWFMVSTIKGTSHSKAPYRWMFCFPRYCDGSILITLLVFLYLSHSLVCAYG